MRYLKYFENHYNITTSEIYNALEDSIEEFNKNHDSGWYMQGGCYEFAYSLVLVLKHFNEDYKIWTMGQDIHIVVEFNNKYWDISGPEETLYDKEYDFYTDVDEDRSWKIISDNDLKNCIHKSGHLSGYENAIELINSISNELNIPPQ